MNRICTVIPLSMIAVSAFSQNADLRPNVLICMADDAGHMGKRWSPWINTPAYNRVCEEGVNFLNAYTCNSKSAPSRAAVITGRNSWQLEEAANHWCEFPIKFKSFPEGLKSVGYQTGYTGKGWGPGIALNEDGSNRELTGKGYNKIKLVPPTTGINKIDYAANFRQFLDKRNPDKPFCFWFGAREPHRGYEWNSSERYGKTLDMIPNVPGYWPDNDTVRRDMLDYAVEVEYFDSQLQSIIDMLEEDGLLDNTIVIVTSDHGMPFPRCKGNDYIDAMRVPLAIMWGKNVRNPGREISEYVSLIDIAPTIIEACGFDAQEIGMHPITGRSLIDVLQDDKASSKFRNSVLMGRERHDPGRPGDKGYPIRALLQDNMLYIYNFESDRWPAGNPSTGYMDCDGSPTKTEILKCRTKGGDNSRYWELCMGFRPNEELYDISSDPECIVNLAVMQEYKQILGKMQKTLFDKLKEEGDPRMSGNGEIFDTYPNKCPAHDFYERISKGETDIPTNWINISDFEPGID